MYPLQLPKLGFLINSIGPSELAVNIMQRSLELEDLSVYLFWINLDRACLSNLNMNAHYSEAYCFDGPIIATCFESAAKLINLPTPNPKFFFINDLEWIYQPQKQYEQFESIYRNPELTLLTRCEDHKNIVEKAWNVKVHRIIHQYNFFEPDFIKELLEKNVNLYSGRQQVPITPLCGDTNLLNI